MNPKAKLGKAPGFWWYPADFERDVQMLPLSAQGLWVRMLGWMHENEAHRGFLELPTGEPMTLADITAKAGKPPKEVEGSVSAMERIGVFSRDNRGCIYCRRMARETHISSVRREAAKARAKAAQRAVDGSFAGDFAPANSQQNVSKSPTVSDSVSDSVSDISTTPLTPRPEFDYESRFREVWETYPQKGRVKIMDSQRWYIDAVRPDPERIHARIIESILPGGKWAQSEAWAKGFVPGLSEWLRNQRWLEDPPQADEAHHGQGTGQIGGFGGNVRNGRAAVLEAARKSLEEADLSDVETAY